MNFFDDFKPKSEPREMPVKRSRPDDNIEYLKRMKEAAVIQRQLFLEQFDPETCTRKEVYIPKKSPWSRREPEPSAYQRLAMEYWKKMDEVKAASRGTSYSSDKHWWESDPDEVLEYILSMVCQPIYDKSLRVQDEFSIRREQRGTILYLCEQVHLQSISSSSYTSDDRIYHYSQDEIDEKRRNLKNWQDARDFRLSLERGPVYSSDTKQVYASGADYVFSAENYLTQDWERSRLERSMYTSSRENVVYAKSNSRHGFYLFEVAEIDLQDGVLKDIRPLNNNLVGVSGDLIEKEITRVSYRDSMVLAAYYLGSSDLVKQVSQDFLHKLLLESSDSTVQMQRKAEAITLLANKL